MNPTFAKAFLFVLAAAGAVWGWHTHRGWVIAAVVVLAAGAAAWWLARSSSRATVHRWGTHARRKRGVASPLDIWRFSGGHAMRAKAGTVRPSMAGMGTLSRARVPVSSVAVLLCRVGAQRIWSSIEDVALTFGGPRTGKSGWLAGRILDAPGAVLVTSTRIDLHAVTSPLRAHRGPVLIFNAVGLGKLASTVTFDPITGCADPVTAAERATDLLAATGTGVSGDRAYWDQQATRVLGALVHAAALGGLNMRDVSRWVATPSESKGQILRLLRRSPEPSYVQDAAQFLDTNDRTRSSITSTIMPALGWLTSATAWAATTGGTPLDVGSLLATRGTVYLLGAEEAHVAPLVTALTGHIAREARRLAAEQPGGRLDPPLTLCLDEAALICPVPLDSWTADMGGRGVSIIAAFQSRAQLIARWAITGAATILNNAGSIMVFGGTRDRDDLAYWSGLAGERDEPLVTRDGHGAVTSRTVRKTEVISPARFASLPAGKVVAFRRGMPPVIGVVQMAWNRRDVKQSARAARRRAAIEAAATFDATDVLPPPPPVRATAQRVGEPGVGDFDWPRATREMGEGDDG